MPPTYPDHLIPFNQDRKSTTISVTPIEQGTSPPGARVPIRKHSIIPSLKTEDLPSIASACSSIVQHPTPSPSPPTVGDKAKSIVKLRAPTITNMASVIAAHPPRFSAALTHVISARPAEACVATSVPDTTASEIFAAASANELDVAILNSGATHHLWHSHEAFVFYKKVYNQYVTLADNTKIPISGKGVIAIEMGSKKVIMRNVYHVPALRLPLWLHRPFCKDL